jgi:ubiquinol-cytochrome c reductase cytochrome b subunit
MIEGLLRWIEERTGIPGAVRHFFSEEIPASAGWAQVFGSVVLFLFFTQVFTGVLLAFNYAPTPGEAYRSLNYIMREVTGGRMVRGLHHWGSSLMIGAVVLHMIQVFIYGAYRKPREATWIVGVTLLLITLGFGLTGYLLPWDNRAYWGTVVTTEIAGQAPLAGAYIRRLLGATDGVGAVTFAHFYALHTALLPIFAFLLVALHVALVRHHGIAPAPFDDRPKRKFFPEQVFKDVCAIFAVFAVLFFLAAAAGAPLERLADPTDTTYIPRPEWYFLFLFQTLKFFRGAAEPIGSVGLPTLAIALLFAVPFLDRSRLKRVTERTFAIGLVALSAVTGVSLTIAAVVTTPHSAAGTTAGGWSQMAPAELAGYGYFREAGCSKCHNLIDGQPKAGPNLAELAAIKPVSQITAHFMDDPSMAGAALSPDRIESISAFLRRLTPDNAETFSRTPGAVLGGARIFAANACGSCHSVNGVGGTLAPPLNGISQRRSREWVAQHLMDPKSQTPGSIMPPFHFTERDRDLLISYLFLLPGG